GVGRYAPSRLVVLSYERGRDRLDARASVASEDSPAPGRLALLRETVIITLGDRHLDDLPTIADPLVVTDLPTLLWSPHGHREAVDALLELAQATLVDSIEEPVWRDALEWACELDALDSVTVRHHPSSTVAGMLLLGWLASRLDWALDHAEIVSSDAREGVLSGTARADGREIALKLEAAPELTVPGLAGVSLSSSSGLRLVLDRGPGGLRARRHDPDGRERE